MILQRFMSNVKMIGVFIAVDVAVTMLMAMATGLSFVMLNSVAFKVLAAIISVGITAGYFAVRDKE
ncbi:hypothetical protein [Yersinia phage vB_YenM_P778]